MAKGAVKRAHRPAAETRKHVLDVASRLFYAEGIHAVGVDRIAQEAGVTTTTLYRLFGSKDGLVVAYLQRAREDWALRLQHLTDAAGLPAFFDEVDDEARQPDHRGCIFRMALTEYPAAECEVHRLAVDSKLRIRDHFRTLLAAAGHPDADVRADQLMLILDGIQASAPDRHPGSPPGPGPQLVRELLASAP